MNNQSPQKDRQSPLWSLEQLQSLFGDIDLKDQVRGVSIDSRTLQKNDLFVALKGERFDGSVFAEQALEKGASCVLMPDSASKHIAGQYIVNID
ncbi:MAG: Mur ligase domain-containing protein, partial [Pseudomonadota bacterium]